MARGQDGSLLLYDSCIHYFTPVYPDASKTGSHSHRGDVSRGLGHKMARSAIADLLKRQVKAMKKDNT
jgi:hypothetical protein